MCKDHRICELGCDACYRSGCRAASFDGRPIARNAWDAALRETTEPSVHRKALGPSHTKTTARPSRPVPSEAALEERIRAGLAKREAVERGQLAGAILGAILAGELRRRKQNQCAGQANYLGWYNAAAAPEPVA